MVYELRVYHMHPGKMEAINRRFSEVTMDLFSRHGVKVVDFWEDAEGKDTLYYVVEYEDREARERNFNAFLADPEWIEAKRASEADGPIVKEVEAFFMKRSSYSPMSR